MNRHLVKLPAVEFAYAWRALQCAASKDESRPVLTAVELEVQQGGAWLAATDSYHLMWTSIGEDVTLDVESKSTVAIRDPYGRISGLARDIVRHRKKWSVKEVGISWSLPCHPVTIDCDTEIVGGVAADRAYPDWRKLTYIASTPETEATPAIRFMGRLLGSWLRAMSLFGAGPEFVCQFDIVGQLKPAKVSATRPGDATSRLNGLLMPVRIT